MAKRYGGLVSKQVGRIGYVVQFKSGKMTELHGATVKFLDNRSFTGGLLVEIVKPHGPYVRGERVIIGLGDFVQ